MHTYYGDILDRIDVRPLWFDENAVPRFDPFTPEFLADIYANEAVLAEIACQCCHERFRVAMSRSSHDDVMGWLDGTPAPSLADRIRDDALAYGDPPNIRCCDAGPTMSSDFLRVLEFWQRGPLTGHDWRRQPTPVSPAAPTPEG